ncbi:aspartyl/asparaginyl beta-hydroxylase domain-containing protein [bacterium]|nr:aspartyl/asparaginyl beta-hydroxylase domain-containing protein [bacterium]
MKEFFQTDAKYLKLDIPVPFIDMYFEAENLIDRFTAHRPSEQLHQGWKSLTLYGLDNNRHENWNVYGYSSASEAAKDFVWSEESKACPIITNWLQNVFPCNRYGRVRLMLLEPGGYIGFHNDGVMSVTENINIAITNPPNCKWLWKDGTELEMQEGGVYAMNLSYEHSVVNHSNEPRLHMIVARHDSTIEWKQLIQQSADASNQTGKFILLDAVP